MRPQEFQPLDSAVIPRFAEPATFMRTPYVSSYAGLDIASSACLRSGSTTWPALATARPRSARCRA